MTRFETSLKQLAEDNEVKEISKGLMREMVVLVRQTKYDGEKQKFQTKFQNVNVLVGTKSDIQGVKHKIDDFITKFGGTFEKLDKIKAIDE